jgi:hypothetical protein
MTGQPSITCPICQRVSYNLDDIVKRYCGACGWHDQTPVHEITSGEEFEKLAAERGLPDPWYASPEGIRRVMDNLARNNESPPLGIVRVEPSSEVGGDEYHVESGPLAGLVVRKLPVNPTPEEEQKIIDAGVAFIMGEEPPDVD